MEKKGRRVRSARGEVIDFDLMEIKSQMANHPKPTDVKKRETFIESRLHRRAKKLEQKTKKLAEELLMKQDKKSEEEKKIEENDTEMIVEEDVKPKIRQIKKKVLK